MDLTAEQQAEYAAQGAADFVRRALQVARAIAAAAQRGETLVVAQYLKNLESLDAEAERFWLAGCE